MFVLFVSVRTRIESGFRRQIGVLNLVIVALLLVSPVISLQSVFEDIGFLILNFPQFVLCIIDCIAICLNFTF